MTRMPNNYGYQPGPPPQISPPPRRRRFQPRWEILAVVVVLLLMAWLLGNVIPSVTWQDVMTYLSVRDRERYSKLCVLGLTAVGVCLGARILAGRRDSK